MRKLDHEEKIAALIEVIRSIVIENRIPIEAVIGDFIGIMETEETLDGYRENN